MSAETELLDLLQKVGAGTLPAPAEVDGNETRDDVTSYIETNGTHEEATSKNVPKSPSVTLKNLFVHPDVHSVVLGLSLLKKYGSDWLGWESETLELRVPHDFSVKEISHLNLSKIQAIKALHLVDTYWQRWEVFLWCTMPFNNVFPDFEIMQVPTVAQCMISVDTASRIRTDVPWSEEIKAFMSAVFRHDGVFHAIEPLDFVQVDDHDVIVDCADVRNRWPSVRQSDKALPATSFENSQLNLLLDVHRHLREHQNMLREQLPLVDHV
jgi:hypothetical protein